MVRPATRTALSQYPSETLLVVDLIETGEPLARIHWMIDEVNRCTRGDAIRARQRRGSDNGHDLIALTCTSDAGSRLTDPLATVETTSLIARAGRCAGQRPTADSAATTASLPGSTRGLIA